MPDTIADIRKEYQLKTLLEDDVDPDPLGQFHKWWKEAIASKIVEPNAMTLATSSPDGVPSARIVLLKGVNEKGFSFFTNYDSFKGQQLEENPRACLVFFWKELERQVRITGLTEKLSPAESDEYFISRPEGSRLGAWASPQSRVIPDRGWLENQLALVTKTYHDKKIERPDYWGGYLVRPINIEFWQGRPSRLHDRIQYTLQDEGNWMIERLAP